MAKKESLIYVITNPDFAENCVKIGYTTDLAGRLATFNTGAPKDYEVFCTYDVPDIQKHKPDKMLHALLTKLDPSLKVNPKKEFFYLYPEEAYDILKYIAIMHDREDCLHLYGTYKARKASGSAAATASSPTPKGHIYSVKGATLVSDGSGSSYTLLKGAVLRPWNGKKVNEQYKKMQDDQIANGGAKVIKGETITQIDLVFNSPSKAAQLVFCTSKNGRETFKDADGKTINDIEGKK